MGSTSDYESKIKLLESLMIEPFNKNRKRDILKSLGLLGELYAVLDENGDGEKHLQAIKKLRTEGDCAAINSIEAFIFCLSGAWMPTGVAPRHASLKTIGQLLAELIEIGDKTRFNQIMINLVQTNFLANLGRAMTDGDPVMIDLLITLLQESDDSHTRIQAAETLGETECERAVEPLIKALDDDGYKMYRDYDRFVRESAAIALGNLTFEGKVELFLELFINGKHHLPGIALEELMKIGKPAIPGLKALYQKVKAEEKVKDDNYTTKMHILEILVEIDPDLKPKLLEEKHRLSDLFQKDLSKFYLK